MVHPLFVVAPGSTVRAIAREILALTVSATTTQQRGRDARPPPYYCIQTVARDAAKPLTTEHERVVVCRPSFHYAASSASAVTRRERGSHL
jgi:hypothetical protein